MGMFDTIRIGENAGQVKCWDSTLEDYHEGDSVPSWWDGGNRHYSYSIAMLEGGFVNIGDLKIGSWTDNPIYATIIDKWGSRYREGVYGPWKEEEE